MISRDQLKRLFPRASESTLRANTGAVCETRGVAAQQTIAQPESQNMATAPALASCDVRPRILCDMRASTDEENLYKTEKRYLAYLRTQNYEWIGIQNVTLKLADDTRFTADFCTVKDHRFTLHDVKAFWKIKGKPHIEDDAKAKINIAAHQFPFFFFVLAWEENGQWITREIKP